MTEEAEFPPPIDRGSIAAEPLSVDLPAPAPNEPLPLYEGAATIDFRDAHLEGWARVDILWTPRTRLVCGIEIVGVVDSRSVSRAFSDSLNQDINLTIDSRRVSSRLRRLVFGPMGPEVEPAKPWIELEVYESWVIGTADRPASEVRFELVNMNDVYGSPVRRGEYGFSADRIDLASSRWTVEIDALENSTAIVGQLKTEGGYAITHRGRAFRSDGSSITPEEAQEFVTTLQLACSFAMRRWIAPVRWRGYTSEGELAWEVWALRNVDPWSEPLTWFSGVSVSNLSEVFRAIDDRWVDPYWQQLLRTAVHYYLDASGDGLVNRHVIMGCSLLELIGWHVVVEDRHLLGRNGYDRLETADKFRLLLRLLGLDLSIPPELAALSRLGKRYADLAAATAEVRHTVVHARRHQEMLTFNSHLWSDFGRLVHNLCDLAMLYLLGYSGDYVNVVTCRYAAEAHPVPWAQNRETHR